MISFCNLIGGALLALMTWQEHLIEMQEYELEKLKQQEEYDECLNREGYCNVDL